MEGKLPQENKLLDKLTKLTSVLEEIEKSRPEIKSFGGEFKDKFLPETSDNDPEIDEIMKSIEEGHFDVPESVSEQSKEYSLELSKKLIEIEEKNSEDLKKLGLGLEKAKMWGERPAFFLESGSAFNSFLETISKNKLNDAEKNSLNYLLNTILLQVKVSYNPKKEDDRIVELFGNLTEMINKFQTISKNNENFLGNRIKELTDLKTIYKEGFLNEYWVLKKDNFEGILLGERVTTLYGDLGSPEHLKERVESIKKISSNFDEKIKSKINENMLKEIRELSEKYKENPFEFRGWNKDKTEQINYETWMKELEEIINNLEKK